VAWVKNTTYKTSNKTIESINNTDYYTNAPGTAMEGTYRTILDYAGDYTFEITHRLDLPFGFKELSVYQIYH
jgi:hypothetical protein